MFTAAAASVLGLVINAPVEVRQAPVPVHSRYAAVNPAFPSLTPAGSLLTTLPWRSRQRMPRWKHGCALVSQDDDSLHILSDDSLHISSACCPVSAAAYRKAVAEKEAKEAEEVAKAEAKAAEKAAKAEQFKAEQLAKIEARAAAAAEVSIAANSPKFEPEMPTPPRMAQAKAAKEAAAGAAPASKKARRLPMAQCRRSTPVRSASPRVRRLAKTGPACSGCKFTMIDCYTVGRPRIGNNTAARPHAHDPESLVLHRKCELSRRPTRFLIPCVCVTPSISPLGVVPNKRGRTDCNIYARILDRPSPSSVDLQNPRPLVRSPPAAR